MPKGTRMRNCLLTALAACSMLASAAIAAPAGATGAMLAEPSLQVAAKERQEAAAEAAEVALEQAEVAEAQAEDLAFANPSSFVNQTAEQYPAMYARIVRIDSRLARLRVQKAVLRALPLHAKRRKAFLHRKHERIVEELHRRRSMFEKLRGKRQADRT
jgi:hypothetical protein